MVRRKRILIIDDDVDITSAARLILETVGYDVFTAGGEEAGFEAACSHKPDLVLLDMMMEENDSGARLAHRLGREPALKETPIIILTNVRLATGFAFTPTTQQDFEWIGVDGWLEKPISPKQLIDLADRMLQKAPDTTG